MRLLFILTLVILLSLCVSSKRGKHYVAKQPSKLIKPIRRVFISFPKLPALPKSPKLPAGANQKKKDVLDKMRQVGSIEDFLKMFKIPFKKVAKHPKKPTTPKSTTFINRNKGLTMTSFGKGNPFQPAIKTTGEEEKVKYNYVLSDSSSSSKDNVRKTSYVTNTVALSNVNEIDCQPRRTVYSLPHSEAHLNFPSCFMLNQCGGCCTSPGHACEPTELNVEQKPYIRLNYLTGYSQETVTLSHHKKCACQCKTKPEDCMSTQYYDRNYCGCFCKSDQGTCPINKTWSQTKCQCVCKRKKQCFHRQVWNEASCGCQCIKLICAKGSIQDPSTCLCVAVSSQK